VVLKSDIYRIAFLETPLTWLTPCLVNRRHSQRCGDIFDSFPLLLTKVKELAEGRKTEVATCKLVGCQLTKTCCIIRQLVDLLCVWSIGGLCVAIPFRDGLLAGVGIFSSPVKEVLSNALMRIIVRKTMEAIFFAAWLVPRRNGNCVQPLL